MRILVLVLLSVRLDQGCDHRIQDSDSVNYDRVLTRALPNARVTSVANDLVIYIEELLPTFSMSGPFIVQAQRDLFAISLGLINSRLAHELGSRESRGYRREQDHKDRPAPGVVMGSDMGCRAFERWNEGSSVTGNCTRSSESPSGCSLTLTDGPNAAHRKGPAMEARRYC